MFLYLLLGAMWSGCLWWHLTIVSPGPHVSVSIRGDNTGGSASTIVTPRLWSFYKHIYLIFNSILSLSGIIIVPEKIFFPSYTHNEKWIQKNWACLEGDRKFKALVMLHRVTTPLAPSQATLHLLRDPGGEISSRPIKLLLCLPDWLLQWLEICQFFPYSIVHNAMIF